MDNNTEYLEKNIFFPSVLFHFTHKIENLQGILKNFFYPSYSLERIVGLENQQISFGVPMVSFCDLRISETKYLKTYGDFAIGLTKTWANVNMLNPVLYMNNNSMVTYGIMSGIAMLQKILKDESRTTDQKLDIGFELLLHIYEYLKNYEGELRRKNGETVKEYRFANEREWRYVPSIQGVRAFNFLSEKGMSKEEFVSNQNVAMRKYKLIFSPKDVKYLIVPDDNNAIEMIEYLSSLKTMYSLPEIQLLQSRILTREQIHLDT